MVSSKEEAFSFTDLNLTWIRFGSIFLLIAAPIGLVVSIIISIMESSIEPLLYMGGFSVLIFLFALWRRKRHKKE